MLLGANVIHEFGAIVRYVIHLPRCFRYTMVRTYIKKPNAADPKYTKEDLTSAINEVNKGQSTIYGASKRYKIPYVTLHSRIKGIRGKKKENKGRPTSIPIAEELKLANGLKTLEKWGFGLSRKEVFEVVGKFVRENNIKTNFKDGVPGEDWFLNFKRRHNMSLKIPQNVEYARKKALDPFIIYGYFDLLEKTLIELQLLDKPHRIWNLDESSLSIDPRKSKVVGAVNKASSRTISSPGKENTTILLMCNAAGGKAPPLIIFKGKHLWDQWIAPPNADFPGTVYAASRKGWMESDIFKNYFLKTLIPALGPERPVLIAYDGHSTHISLDILEAAIQNNITILKLPPHSSHLLQPLDLSVFRPFKLKWDEKLISWQRQHVGQRLPKKMFSQFLCETWKAIPAEVIKGGFRKGGISPLNKNVIPEEAFSPESLKRWNDFTTNPPNIEEAMVASNTVAVDGNSIADDTAVATTSEEMQLEEPIASTSFENLLLSVVRQAPKPEQEKKSRICPGSEILTSEEAVARLKENNKKQNNQKKAGASRPAKRNKKRPISSSSEDTEPESPPYMDSDNPEEFLQSFEEANMDINEDVDQTVNPNSWVLVRYCTKKLIKHFVGMVTEPCDDGLTVKFTKFSKNTFSWPKVEDMDTIEQRDIVMVLPEPTVNRRGSFVFPVTFEGYNLT